MKKTEISIRPTPNPNAIKVLLKTLVKTDGKSTYKSPLECSHNPFACALFTVRGISRIHFFQNVITVTKTPLDEWEAIEPELLDCIVERFHDLDPNLEDPDPEAERRASLSGDLKDIVSIIDEHIRPALHADGGDMQCISFENNILIIKFQGACGNCPSALTGTLEAIKSVLRAEFNPEIDIFIAPEY